MPYTIKTEDGIIINNIPDDVKSDAPELKSRVAAERSKRNSGSAGEAQVSSVLRNLDAQASARMPSSESNDPDFLNTIPNREYGRKTPLPANSPTSAQQDEEQIKQVIKYGPTIAASMATGGLPLLTRSAAIALSQFSGSMASGDTARQAAADAVIVATPIINFGKIAPFMPKVDAAKLIASRVAVQIPVAAAFEQTSQAVGGTFEKPKDPADLFGRLLTPTTAITGGLVAGGGVIEGVAASALKAQGIRVPRGDNAGMLASELDPSFIPLEARRIVAGDPRARIALRDLYSDYDSVIFDMVSKAPNSSQIAAEIAPFVGKRQALVAAVKSADAAAEQAQREYVVAVRSGSSNVSRAKEAATETAQKAAFERAAFDYEMNNFLGEGVRLPSLSALSSGQNTETLQKVINTTFDEQKSALGRMWGEVGIGLNDPLMTAEGLTRRIKTLSKDQNNMLSGEDAKRAALAQVKVLFPKIVGEKGPILVSRERYLNLRDEIADGLEKNGMIRNRAEKLAGEMYSAVRGAADDYIVKFMPDKAEKWQSFNKTAANWYDARSNPVIKDFVNPQTGSLREGKSAELVGQIISGNAAGTLRALNNFADSIAANGDSASIAAAQTFKDGVSTYIAKGVLESATINRATGLASEAAQFDPTKLYQTVNKMASGGYDVSLLGFGKPEDLNRLAKMASNNMVTGKEVTTFFNELGALGGDVASSRMAFRRELKQNLLADFGVRRSAEDVRRTLELSKRANIDAATAQAELAAAEKDPLIAALGIGNFGFTADITSGKIGDALNSLLAIPNKPLRSLVSAIGIKKPELLKDMRARKIADLMEKYSNVIPGAIPSSDIRGLRNFMYSPSFDKERQGLQILLGDDEYKNLIQLVDKVVPRSLAEAKLANQLGITSASPDNAAKGLFAAAGFLSGSLQTGTVAAAGAGNVKKLFDGQRYSMLHYLYINPSSASSFAKIGYNLDKFVNQSEIHRVSLQLAAKKDDERQQAKAEQQAQESPQ